MDVPTIVRNPGQMLTQVFGLKVTGQTAKQAYEQASEHASEQENKLASKQLAMHTGIVSASQPTSQ